ncbi:MAG: hypothetical protein WAW10_07575 [Gallionella sp.]
MNSSSFPFKPSLHSGSKLAACARLYGGGKEKTGNMPAWVKSKVIMVSYKVQPTVVYRFAPLSHKWERELLNFMAIELFIIEDNNAALVGRATPDAAGKARPTVNVMNYGKVNNQEVVAVDVACGVVHIILRTVFAWISCSAKEPRRRFSAI